MQFTVAALVEFSTKREEDVRRRTYLRLYEPDQAACSFENLVTCHPENIRLDVVLPETANENVD